MAILPFISLLLAIAIVPAFWRRWWEKYYPAVSIGLGAITVVYYAFFLKDSSRVAAAGMDYLSLVVLIGSLFIVSGGIYIHVRDRSTPVSNVVLLGIGAILSNILGTIGASMILIRPYLRMNRHRLRPFQIVFFIFIISNIGGALTPIGNPPLFLGYLRGVPFFWMLQHFWDGWLISVSLLLAVFFLIDRKSYAKFQVQSGGEVLTDSNETMGIEGSSNIAFLIIVLAATFIERPPLLRELIMALAALGSYITTREELRRKNAFAFGPLNEVAILFLGIFATMIPALDWLESNAQTLGISTVGQFYWGSGILSSILDNAPTYLSFLSAAIGVFVNQGIVQQIQYALVHGPVVNNVSAHANEIRRTVDFLLKYQADAVAGGYLSIEKIKVAYIIANQSIFLKAISVGAVFFGGLTYIGNVPNLMVKSVAEHMGTKMPTFLGYIFRYSIPLLIPVLILVWLLLTVSS